MKGFNGAQYKGFKSEYEALSYLGQSQAAGQHMGINAQSRGIAKHTSCATDSRGAAAALRAQQAFASRADMTEAADLGSRQTDSAACQSGRPCAEPQQLYRLVRTSVIILRNSLYMLPCNSDLIYASFVLQGVSTIFWQA